MADKFQPIFSSLAISPRRLFLIDGLGAFFTAFFLGAVLAQFENVFGMPHRVLYALSLVACLYTIYSMCCWFFVSDNWHPYLKGIAIANAIYLCITIGLVFYYYQSLTSVGLVYFLLELVIMSGLIVLELKILTHKVDKKM